MSTAPCKPAADYRTDAPRVDGWSYERQATFLMTLSETGLVSQACKFAEMSVASAYSLRREPRGRAFALGWQAAHLLARDRLEDVLLEAAITGVESVSTRVDGVTRRRCLNSNLSMAVLKRLDSRAAALDDRAVGVARSIGAAFEDFITLVLGGCDDAAIDAFLEANPDPLAPQVEAAAARDAAPTPQFVEKSPGFSSPAVPGGVVVDPITALRTSPVPCSCPADQSLALLEAA
jgi:hypothetical protein